MTQLKIEQIPDANNKPTKDIYIAEEEITELTPTSVDVLEKERDRAYEEAYFYMHKANQASKNTAVLLDAIKLLKNQIEAVYALYTQLQGVLNEIYGKDTKI